MNQNLTTLLKCIAPLLVLLAVGRASAAEPAPAAHVVRVGGDYMVTTVDKQGDVGGFLIEFKSVKPTGRFDTLKLETDHVHVAVKVGETLRLSAEIMSSKGAVSEVSQVVVFLPSQEGPVPVWLMSKKAVGRDLNATRYLEMHAPVNDFVIM